MTTKISHEWANTIIALLSLMIAATLAVATLWPQGDSLRLVTVGERASLSVGESEEDFENFRVWDVSVYNATDRAITVVESYFLRVDLEDEGRVPNYIASLRPLGEQELQTAGPVIQPFQVKKLVVEISIEKEPSYKLMPRRDKDRHEDFSLNLVTADGSEFSYILE